MSIVSNAVRFVQLAKASIEAGFKLGNGTILSTPMGEFRGFKMEKCNEVITLTCGLLSSQPGAVALCVAGNYSIVVNDGFYSLSPAAQKAVLLHEVGHLKLAHHKKMETMPLLKRLFGRHVGMKDLVNLEHEADDYSVSKGGDMKQALIELLAHVPGNKEVIARINRLS